MLFQDIERLKSTVSTQDGQISEQSLLSEFGAEEVGGGQVDARAIDDDGDDSDYGGRNKSKTKKRKKKTDDSDEDEAPASKKKRRKKSKGGDKLSS